MKTILLGALLVVGIGLNAQTKTLYLNIGSHNEIQDASPTYGVNYNDHTTYDSVKARISHLLDTLVKYGAKYNMQVESNLILACLNWDNAATSSNDFIETMENHPNVEVDPHNHMDLTSTSPNYNPYNYADLDSLLRKCGIDTGSIVGGFIYKQSDWTNASSENWTTYKTTGVNGNMFPTANWKPKALWGAGTGNHLNDPFSLGIWHPAAATSQNTFLANSPSNIYCIGTGCSWVIQDTTNINELFNDFVQHINYFQSQTPTSNTFYTGTIMFNYRHMLKPYYLDSISKMIRLVDAYEASNIISWKTLDEKLNYWEQTHISTDYFNVLCSNLPVGIEEQINELQGISYFPNPSTGIVNFKNESNEDAEIIVYDVLGKKITAAQSSAGDVTMKIDLSVQNKGFYILSITQGKVTSNQKILLINQ